MKKLALLFVTTLLFVTCTKDETASDFQQVSENNIEIYQKTFDDAFKYLGGNSTVNIDDAIEFLKKMDGVTNVQVNDNIIRVTTQGYLQFSIDYNLYPDYEFGNIDFNALQEYENSVDKALGGFQSNYEQTSEVFKDYISQNTSYKDNTNTTTRTSSNESVIRLVRRNFVIWSPYKRSDFQKEKEDVMKIVKSKTNRCAQTIEFSPKSFKELGAFDVVYLSSHGSKDGSFFLSKSCLSSTVIKEYDEELSKKDSGVEKAIRKIGDERVEGYSLKENFFNRYLPDLSHTVIYTSACYFGADNCIFKKCCEAKGVADYFGSDNACVGADILNAFAEFYPKLMNGASTKMAFKNGNSYFTGTLLKGMTLETFKFKRFGKKTVSYVIPHATGIGNRSNYNNARANNTSSSSSDIVVNVQIRYSTEESDDILKSIEAGICLQDMDTKEVKLIPFSSKNIISNEKKSYDDIAAYNISVSLDNLTEGHQYAYCCYTKVNGVISLSNETYLFNVTKNYGLNLSFESAQYTKYTDDTHNRVETVECSETVKITKKNGKYSISFCVPTQDYLYKDGVYMSPYYTWEESNPEKCEINNSYGTSYEIENYQLIEDNFSIIIRGWSSLHDTHIKTTLKIENMDTQPKVEYIHYLDHFDGGKLLYYKEYRYILSSYYYW